MVHHLLIGSCNFSVNKVASEFMLLWMSVVSRLGVNCCSYCVWLEHQLSLHLWCRFQCG